MIRNLISGFNGVDDAPIDLSLYTKTSFIFPRQHSLTAMYTKLFFNSNGNYFYMVSTGGATVYIHKYQASVAHTIENAAYIGSISVSSTVFSTNLGSGIKQFINDDTFIAWNASAKKVVKVVMTNDLLPTISETISSPVVTTSGIVNVLVSPNGLAVYLITSSGIFYTYELTTPFDIATMNTASTAFNSGITGISVYCQLSYFDDSYIFKQDINNDLVIYKLENKNIENFITIEASDATLTNKTGVYMTPDKNIIYTVGGNTSSDIPVEKFTKGI